jgi:Putative auto-transporter adhesin, head GIN domain
MCSSRHAAKMAEAMSSGYSPTRRHRGRNGLDAALTALGALLAAALILALSAGKFSFQSSGGPAETGSGDAATQVRSLPPFNGVNLTGDNNVVIRVGARQSVVVHADRNLLERVTTRVRAGRLAIGTTPGELSVKSPMYVTVSVPSLDRLELAGHGSISATGIDTPRLTVELPGNGTIEATGTTARLDVTLGGAGTALLGPLTARDATAELSGDGTIMLTATRSLAASVPGTGTIVYGGDPAHVTRRIAGSGTITPG